MQEPELAQLIRSFMQKRQLNQSDFAKQANVSQSSVSRALYGKPLRQGKAKLRICNYIHQQTIIEGPIEIVEAFQSVWDGSAQHAAAIAKIIKASKGLVPGNRTETEVVEC